jgi:hypothetical protein
MLDKRNLIPQLTQLDNVVLDLGCGPLKKNKNWIGIDILDSEGVDIVGDVYEIINAMPNQSVDEVYAYHFFEHVPDVPGLLVALSRILKQTGFIKVVVPHFSNAYFYSDYTHKTFFGLYSFSYLVKDDLLQRRVPNYNVNTGLQLKSAFLHFKSPLLINRQIRKVWQLLFNSSTLMKEWYEDSWSSNFPCYEVEFVLVKI